MRLAPSSATKRPNRLGILAVAAMVVAAVLATPSTAAAAPAWSAEVFQAPTNLPPGGSGLLRILTANVGDSAADEAPTVTFVLPPGVSLQPLDPSSPWSCTGWPTVTCVSSLPGPEEIEPFTYGTVGGSTQPILLPVEIASDAPTGTSSFDVTLSGGGAPTVTRPYELNVGADQLGFGPTPGSFQARILDAEGNDYTQAGGHPYSATFSFAYNTQIWMPPPSPGSPQSFEIQSEGSPRDIVADLPAGLVVDPSVVPRCRTLGNEAQISCPPESQIGVVILSPPVAAAGRLRMYGIYNMVPSRDHPATFGFRTPVGPVVMVPRVRSEGDYGLSATVRSLPQVDVLLSARFTLWGVPADPRHDVQRCAFPNFLALACVGYNEGGDPAAIPSQSLPAESGAPLAPFLTAPTSCSGDTVAQVHLSQWGVDAPFGPLGAPDLSSDGWENAATAIPSMRDCESLSFSPQLGLRPTTSWAASPSGLRAELVLPQNDDVDGFATAHLKDARFVLPRGMVLNPGFADGLGSCAEAQIGLRSAPGEKPLFDGSPADCPPASKIGTVQIDTPVLDSPMTGAVYLAKPWANPFQSRLAAYLVAGEAGVVVKLAARIDADPVSGRVVIAVRDSPQLPFEELAVNLDGGPRAPFVAPDCGLHSGAAGATSWAAPETDLQLQSLFRITSGPALGPCPDGSLDPHLEAGLMSPLAGADSPFVLNLSRDDRTGFIGGLDVSLPEGLLARLKGISPCPEEALAAASRQSGVEALDRTCGASRVGKLVVGAGAGPRPVYLDAGRVYLAGPYKGSRHSLAAVIPAVAGPFDFGNVLVRSSIDVEPGTARITLRSDPIPAMLAGIPLNLRDLRLVLDRPGFIRSPTDCTPKAIRATVRGIGGATKLVTERFQVANCARLPFKPRLAMRFSGPTHRSAHPRVKAVLTTRPTEAGLARAALTLPATESLDSKHVHGICEPSQFRAAACPRSSIYGYAKAWTPLLDEPLEGPVYLRSSSARLPDLAVSLDGAVRLDFAVGLDAVGGRLRTTFGSIPDVPLRRLALTLRGGRGGLLVNNTGLCRARPRADGSFEGQNGRLHLVSRYVVLPCGKSRGGRA
jgi:hypothetical protein